MARILLDSVRKRYGADVDAVDDLTLEAADGELLVVVGPSGSGKSTALRIVAGLEVPDAGAVWVGDRDVTDLPPRQRRVAMVFQSGALYPYLDVAGNIAFGLRIRHEPKRRRTAAVQQVADALGLGHLLDRRPHELSGGERQRVAIGRAMVSEPDAFLMDEPLASLDAPLRHQLRTELVQLRRRLGTTTVFVTHDQEDALLLGDRIAVLRDGRLEQVGTPRDVYERPATTFVAGFIGTPAMNLVEATVEQDHLVLDGLRLPVPAGSPVRTGDRVTVGVRPADLRDADLLAPEPDATGAEVVVVPTTAEHIGSALCVEFLAGTTTMRALLDPRSRATVGQPLCLSVDLTRMSVFDPGTGHRVPVPAPPAIG